MFLCVCVCVRLCVGDLHKVIQILMASFSLSALSHAPSLASTLIACEFSLQFLRRSLSVCLPSCLSICPYFCLSVWPCANLSYTSCKHFRFDVWPPQPPRKQRKARRVHVHDQTCQKYPHTLADTAHSHTHAHTRTQGYICNKTRPGCLTATEHATLDRHEQNKHKLLVWVSSGFQQLMSN